MRPVDEALDALEQELAAGKIPDARANVMRAAIADLRAIADPFERQQKFEELLRDASTGPGA